MIVELRKENEKYDEVKIATLPSRLNEIKGDIKTRNEIIREVLHNSIAENASKIDIKITIQLAIDAQMGRVCLY